MYLSTHFCFSLLCFREQVIKHSLVHKVFLDFFLFAPDKPRTVSSSPTPHTVLYNHYVAVHSSSSARNNGAVWCEIKHTQKIKLSASYKQKRQVNLALTVTCSFSLFVLMWAGDDRVHQRVGRLHGSHARRRTGGNALSVARDGQGEHTNTHRKQIVLAVGSSHRQRNEC